MGNFSIGTAWSEGLAILQRHAMLLLILVGGTVVVAGVIQLFVFGINPQAWAEQFTTSMQGADPQTVLTTMLPGLLGATLFASIVQSMGQFAAMRGVLSDEGDMAGLLVYGLTAAIVSLVFWAIVGFAIAVILGLLLVLLGAGAMFGGDPSAGAMAGLGLGFLLLILLLLPIMLWLATRLWVMQAAMADQRSINPLYGLSAAWRLSSGANQWPMLGYLLLLIIAGLVIFGIIGAIGGVIFGLMGGQVGALLSTVLTGVPTGMLSIAITAGVYRALVPPASGEIFR